MKLLLNSDPSSTITLRRMYAAQYDKKFRTIRGLIRKSIDTNDCFGLKGSINNVRLKALAAQPIEEEEFQFSSNPKKASGFMSWLSKIQESILFEPITGGDSTKGYSNTDYNIWQNLYIMTAYKKGLKWSRQQMRKDKAVSSKLRADGVSIDTSDDAILDALSGPVSVSEVESLYLRAYEDLKGITAAMDAEISRILADGFSQGWNPTRIATEINTKVNKIGRYRANLLARTEVIRAHHLASIAQYEEYGIEGVKVTAEWHTAGDTKVCVLCAPLDYKKTGKLWSLQEIKGKIPVHPLCRCVALPHVSL